MSKTYEYYESSIVYDRPDGNRCYLVIIKKLGSV